MLGIGLLDQSVSAYFVHGAAFLIPRLIRDGYGLAAAGTLVAMPTVGVMSTLILWGVAVDRVGERRVLTLGLGLTAVAALGAALSSGLIALGAFLLIGGMAAASCNSASGRIVVGWFPARRRGLAMGIRQMAQPLGVGIAALITPSLADRFGLGGALWLPAGLAVVAAGTTALLVRDPPRPSRAEGSSTGALANPYRSGRFLVRVHAVSVLLVIPQFTVWTYALVWLISDRGWAASAAGILVALTQLLGALGRIGVGQLSDLVRSRVRPLRWVAVAAAATMATLALLDQLGSSGAVPLLVLASMVTVADNGLAFTSIAEVAGPFWSGRALGVQNTAQFLAASIVAPAVGGLIAQIGYPATFALVALCPAVAAPMVPDRQPGPPVAPPAQQVGSG